MKVTVCFDQVKVIVPCGDGDLTVEELILRAVSRYKNATKKPNTAQIHVRWLETSEDNAILDKDDLVSDVCDDKDKLIAIYNGDAYDNLIQNGDVASTSSSIGTNSPDSFQRHQTESRIFYGTQSLPLKSHNQESSFQRVGVNSLPITTKQSRPSDLSIVAVDTQPRALKARSNPKSRDDVPAFEESSTSSTPVSSPGHEAAPFERTVNRKSISSAHPMLWNWIDSQEKYTDANQQDDHIGNRYFDRGESTRSSTSPNLNDTQNSSICDDESVAEIEITNNDPGSDMGLCVRGYRSASGRKNGLIINNITRGSIAQKYPLQISDRIIEINGISLQDKECDNAEMIFKNASKSSVMTIKRTRAYHQISDNESIDDNRSINKSIPNVIVQRSETNSSLERVKMNNIEHLPIKAAVPVKQQGHRQQKSIRIPVELHKGSEGLGFSLTSRDVSTSGGSNRVFVKNILSKGAAIQEGTLKTGDQLVEINNADVSTKSQSEIVQMLRNTNGLTKLVIVRQEEDTTPTIATDEISAPNDDDSTTQSEVFSLSIRLTESGSAGLGVSVKGKTTGGDNPEDLGIYVKSILKGGAAAKDGRLQPDDQLLRINEVSLIGMTNSKAMDTLRTAMQASMRIGVIHIVMTRYSKQSISSQPTDTKSTVVTTSTTDNTQNDEAIQRSSPVDYNEHNSPQSKHQGLTRKLSDNCDGISIRSQDSNSSSGLKAQRDIIRNKSYFRAVDANPVPAEKGNIIVKTLSSDPYRSLRGHHETPHDKTKHVVSVSEMPSVQQSKTIVIDRPFGVTQNSRNYRGNVTIVQSMVNDVRISNKPLSPTSPISLQSPTSLRSPTSPTSFAPPSYEETLKRQYSGVSKPISLQLNNKDMKVRTAPHKRDTPSKPIINENVLSPVSDGNRNMSVSSQMSIDSMLLGPNSMPFQRDAFGRLSMSERKGRAHLDATKTDFFNKIKKYKSMEELSKVASPTSDEDRTRLSPTFMPALTLQDIMKKDSLKRSESADTALSRLSLCTPDELSPSKRDFPRGTFMTSSTPNYMHNSIKHGLGSDSSYSSLSLGTSPDVSPNMSPSMMIKSKQRPKSMYDLTTRNTGLNSSFRSALEKAEMNNGKMNGLGGGPIIPITMKSNAQYDKPKKKGGFFKGIGNMLKKNKSKREPAKEDRPIAKTPPPPRAIRTEIRRPKSMHEETMKHDFTMKQPPLRKHSAPKEDQLKALQDELEKCRVIPKNDSHFETGDNTNNNNNHIGNNTRIQPHADQIQKNEKPRKLSRQTEANSSDVKRSPPSHSNQEASRRIADNNFMYRPGSLPRQHRNNKKDHDSKQDIVQPKIKSHSDSKIGDSSTFPRKAKVKSSSNASAPNSRRTSRESNPQKHTTNIGNLTDAKGITISHNAVEVSHGANHRLQAMV